MFRLITFLLLSLPVLALAQTTTSTVAGPVPVETLGSLWEAITSKNWPVAIGLAITLIIWLLKKTGILEKIKLGSKQGIRMSVVILATLGAVSAGLMKGLALPDLIMAVIVAASAAFGGWETAGKFLRDRFSKSESKPEADSSDG